MSEPLDTPENELPEQGEETVEDQIAKKLSDICDEYDLTCAVFLSFSEKQPLMWYKGNRLLSAKLTANFTKIVKEEILKDLEV